MRQFLFSYTKLHKSPNVFLKKCSHQAEKWTCVSPYTVVLYSFIYCATLTAYIAEGSKLLEPLLMIAGRGVIDSRAPLRGISSSL